MSFESIAAELLRLAALRDGVDGAPGADGLNGIDGVDGAPGAPGRDGVDGAPGRDGVDGQPGVDGAPGADGAPGRDGVDGLPGADGAPGRDGIDGQPGADGAHGRDGIDGAPGRDGIDGATALSERDRLFAAIPDKGDADATPAIMAYQDAGYSFEGKPDGRYRLDTPLFIDRPGGDQGLYTHRELNIHGELIPNGALMPRLAMIDEATGAWTDTPNRCAVFINVKRTAWDKATNRVGIADAGPYSTKSIYRGTDPKNNDGTPFGISIRNVTVRGLTTSKEADNDLIVFYSMTSGTRVENATLRSFRGFITFANYTDLHTLTHIHHESGPGQYYGPGGDDAAFYVQTSNGDGVTINGCKANAHKIVQASNNRGLVINGLVTARLRAVDCDAWQINGAHEEANIWDVPSWRFTRSGVTVRDSMIYTCDDGEQGTSPLTGAIEIIDAGGTSEAGSHIKIKDTIAIRRIARKDQKNAALVHITSVTDDTTLEFENVSAGEVANNRPGAVRISSLLAVSSSVAAVTAALNTPDALQLLASGTFKLSKIGGTWTVTDLSGCVGYRTPKAHTPILTLAVGANEVYGMVVGSQTPGSSVKYTVATESSPGRFTLPTEKTVTVGSSGGVGLYAQHQPGSVLHVWRSAGTATHYARLLVPDRGSRFFDLGQTVAGVVWAVFNAATHPAPPTSPTSAALERFDGTERLY